MQAPLRRFIAAALAAACTTATATSALATPGDIGIDPPTDECQVLPTLRSGTSLDDAIRAALRDADGEIYLAGYERGTDAERSASPLGDSLGFVEKRAADGTLRWRRTLDTPGIDIIDALALDGRGGVVAAGRTSGALPGFIAGGQLDAVVLAFDADGRPTGALQFGDERPQHPVAVAALASGDVVVAGYDDTHVEGRAVVDFENGFIARLERRAPGELALAWLQRSRLPSADRVTALATVGEDSEDVLFATHIVASPRAGGGVQLRRLDADGRLVWAKPVSNSAWDEITALARSADGRTYAAGASNTGFAGPALGHTDGFVLEFDPADGGTRWSRTLGSAHPAWLGSLAVGADGTVFVAGSAVPAEDFELERPRQQAFGASFDADGGLLWPWATPLSSERAFGQQVLALPGRCEADLLIAGAMAGELPGTEDRGGLDALVIAPDLFELLVGDAGDAAGR